MKNHIFKPGRSGYCIHQDAGEYCGMPKYERLHDTPTPTPPGSVLRDIADDWERMGEDHPNLWYVGYLRGMADVLDSPRSGGVE